MISGRSRLSLALTGNVYLKASAFGGLVHEILKQSRVQLARLIRPGIPCGASVRRALQFLFRAFDLGPRVLLRNAKIAHFHVDRGRSDLVGT